MPPNRAVFMRFKIDNIFLGRLNQATFSIPVSKSKISNLFIIFFFDCAHQKSTNMENFPVENYNMEKDFIKELFDDIEIFFYHFQLDFFTTDFHM